VAFVVIHCAISILFWLYSKFTYIVE